VPIDVRVFLKHGGSAPPLDEILRQPPSVLAGTGAAADGALAALGVRSVFDLGTSWLFANARAVADAAEPGSEARRSGRLPAALVQDTARDVAIEALAGRELALLRGITADQATAVERALGIASIHELAIWPPYRAATAIVSAALGGDGATEDDGAVGLRPRVGEFPTERVYYDSLVMLQAEPDPQPRQDLAAAGPLSLKPAVQKPGFTRLAIGARLTFAQSWYAQGVTLGQLLHSLALAPGEATRVAVIDWTRRSSAFSSESIQENEQLSNTQVHTRSISEVQRAVATETQEGFSESEVESESDSSSSGHAQSSGLLQTLLADGSSASTTEQAASGRSAGRSHSWTTGTRDIAASLQQKVMDRTEQHSTLARGRRASAVREVAQSEHEAISTRIVANYNHMHALTVQYYEVVQIFRVTTDVHAVERVLFVPLQLLDVRDSELVDRYRRVLARAALTPRAAALLTDDAATVRISPTSLRVFRKGLRPDLLERLVGDGAAPAAAASGGAADVAAAKPPAGTVAAGKAIGGVRVPLILDRGALAVWDDDAVSAIAHAVQSPILRGRSHDLFLPDDVELLALSTRNVVPTKVVLDRADGPDIELTATGDSYLEIPGGIGLASLKGLSLAKKDAPPVLDGVVVLHCARGGRRFTVPVPIVLPEGTALRAVASLTTDEAERRAELTRHLLEHHTHYSQAVFRSLDGASVALLLAPFAWNGKPLAEQVDPAPLAVTGNYLVLRAPAETEVTTKGRTDATAWGALVAERGLTRRPPLERLVPLPTGGVFAEAVLGRSNAAEKLDLTRFAQWHEMPIPLAPPEIAAVQAGSRAQVETLVPGQLGPATLGIQAPTALPDPTGLQAILGALATGSLFRDMSGLTGTQAAVQAAQAAAFRAATEAGQLASHNIETEAQKAVAVAQTAAGVVTAALGARAAGLPGVAGRTLSGLGGALNYARDMDARGVPTQPRGSDTEGSGDEASAVDDENGDGGDGGAPAITAHASRLGGSHESAVAEQGLGAGQGLGALLETFSGAAGTNERVTDSGTPATDKTIAELKPAGATLVLVADYDTQFTEADEIADFNSAGGHFWAPARQDFEAAATHSGFTAKTIDSFQTLKDAILARSKRSLGRVVLISHGNSSNIGLSGLIRTNGLTRFFDNFFGKSELEALSASEVADLRSRFRSRAQFVVLSCHAGLGTDLVDSIAKTFRVDVLASDTEVTTCCEAGSTVTKRGKMRVRLPTEPEFTVNCSDAQPGFNHLVLKVTRKPKI
jgi:hypothetical protein